MNFVRECYDLDWFRRAQPTAGSSTPGKVVQGFMRKQASMIQTESQQTAFFCFLLQALSWVPAFASFDDGLSPASWRNPFLSYCFWSLCFISVAKSILEQLHRMSVNLCYETRCQTTLPLNPKTLLWLIESHINFSSHEVFLIANGQKRSCQKKQVCRLFLAFLLQVPHPTLKKLRGGHSFI